MKLGMLVVTSVIGIAALSVPVGKVQVCHLPPGDPGGYRTLSVSASALASHLGHGDLAGSCESHCGALCSTGDPCSMDTGAFDPAIGRCACSSTPIAGCCLSDADCPNDLCRWSACRPGDNRCTSPEPTATATECRESANLCVATACDPLAGCVKSESVCDPASGPCGRVCSLQCVDVSSDPANCGACGHSCDPGMACVRGSCSRGIVVDPPNPVLSDCSGEGRSCRNIVPVPASAGFTLGNLSFPVPPYVHIAVTNKNQLARLDTRTGEKRWQASTFGQLPSRVAVALDGSVWVGNRCIVGGRENDFNCSNVAHLDTDGNLICRGDVPGWVRGLAIDAAGDVIVGAYNGQQIWKVSGSSVHMDQMPPRCRILGSVAVGVPVYGLAVDSRGFAWTATSPTVKVDLSTMTVTASVPNASTYGIAIDWKNRVWHGGLNGGGNMHRIDGDPPYAVLDVPGTAGVSAVTIAPDGVIWGSSYSGTPYGLVKVTLTPDGLGVASVERFADPEGVPNHGVAVDAAGKIWSPQVLSLGTVNRWSPSGDREARFVVDAGADLYSYSDMTGSQLRSYTIRNGTWTQRYDGGGASAWNRIEWTSALPPGSFVEVRARGGDVPGAFTDGTATGWCGPTQASPLLLGSCAELSGKRYLEVEVTLSTTQERPEVSELLVFAFE